jgi:sec-independent protein translocase protein TatA
MTSLFAFGGLTPTSVILLLLLGVLLFGRKLPEIGKYLGKGIVEFKKGMRGMEDEIETSHNQMRPDPSALEAPRPPQRVATTAPKFEDSPGAIQQPPGVQHQPAPQQPQPPQV